MHAMMAAGFDDLLHPDAVMVGLPAAGKARALQMVATRLATVHGLDGDAVLAAMNLREAAGTTGFGGGIAIPHGRLARLPAMVGAVARLAQPIEYGAIDGAPVGLLFVLLAPEGDGAAHLKALARISRALRDRVLLAKLAGARDAAALWALLAGRAEARTAA
jgi:nitrogen PTS system EIIA component